MHFYMHSYVDKIFILVKSGCYTRICTQGTTLHGQGRPKDGSARTQPTIQKILKDYGVLPKA
jgi:hypothetical protein